MRTWANKYIKVLVEVNALLDASNDAGKEGWEPVGFIAIHGEQYLWLKMEISQSAPFPLKPDSKGLGPSDEWVEVNGKWRHVTEPDLDE